jgi:hypothetical protein
MSERCHRSRKLSKKLRSQITGSKSVFDGGFRDLVVGVPAHHHHMGTRIGQMSLGVERDIVV